MTRVSSNARHSRQFGLTLIELMVVVAVLAILATIAIPTYQRYTLGARRADGKAGVTAVALAQERHFSVYQSYADKFTVLQDNAGLDTGLVVGESKGQSPKLHYALTLALANGDFTVTATPNFPDPDCTTMTLDGSGAKGGTPENNKCW